MSQRYVITFNGVWSASARRPFTRTWRWIVRHLRPYMRERQPQETQLWPMIVTIPGGHVEIRPAGE